MQREDCKYTPFYCEENVWHLAQEIPGRASQVVLISNPAREVLMFRQRGFREVAVWDYHVILAVDGVVYDLDTSLSFPCPVTTYLARSFAADAPARHAPWFRVVAASRFVAEFASDRRHMRDAAGGFLHAPPPWPAIHAARGSNLMQFIDMQRTFTGVVYDLPAVGAALAPAAPPGDGGA